MTTIDDAAGLRASDTERRAAVEFLQEAAACDLLTDGEDDERMAAAFDARLRDELPALTAAPSGPGLPKEPRDRHP